VIYQVGSSSTLDPEQFPLPETEGCYEDDYEEYEYEDR
jgi:hypothetical protein